MKARLWLVTLLIGAATLSAAAQTPQPADSSTPQPADSPAYPRITTRGQIQIQHDDGDLGAASGDDPQPVLNGIGSFPAHDTVGIRRMRLVTTLHLNEDVSLVNESNFDTRSNNVSVLDMYLRAQLADSTHMRAGMFKIPFGWEGLRSSRTTNTIEMSDVTRALSNFRDSGLAAGWQQDGWDLNLAVVQGQGNVWTDENGGKDVIGRLTYEVDDHLKVGGSFHFGSHTPAGTNADLPVRRWGVEMQYHEAPWKVEAEYLWSDGFNFVSRSDSRADGFYVALVYQADERNDLVLHFDRFEPHLDNRRPVPANNANTRNRLVLGWNYYFQREPEHRLMVNYEFRNEEEGPAVSNNGFRIRYQYAW